MTQVAKGPRRKPHRVAAEIDLMSAAAEMLEREGVLTDLSTQQVADNAGLNRGLIHHYFGGKRELLRAAVAHKIASVAVVNERWRRQPPGRKRRAHFRQSVKDPVFARMIMILALDRDPTLKPIPYVDERLEDLRREQADGFIAEGVDLPALLALWEATISGYAVLRTALGEQLGITPEALDRRVLALLETQYAVHEGPGH